MDNVVLWYSFAGLFLIAAIMNFARGKRRMDGRGSVNRLLGASCILWAGATICFRFGERNVAMIAAGGAVIMMGIAAIQSMKLQQ
ncbi:MAG: hypothetical protein ABJA67_05730 [Chthonomonadales bacterium]